MVEVRFFKSVRFIRRGAPPLFITTTVEEEMKQCLRTTVFSAGSVC